ncbi:MAG: hypothetical protein IT208_02950 [Chthonomonadales bacterium]|nr:hypothetical protein [Chthonomonadales bacterium]
MNELCLEYKPDAARAFERIAAWWEKGILDRPTLQVTAPAANPRPVPRKEHATLAERWMDVEHTVACADAWIASTYWGGEILPAFFPNLGPEVLTAALGAPLEFMNETSYSVPILRNWADVPNLAFDPASSAVRTVAEMTRRGLEVGSGRFLTGITDLHPGGDLAASLRDPQQLCVDLAETPEQVHALMGRLRPTFYQFFVLQHEMMRAAGQTITTSWLPLCAEGRYYIPSNDFSCMVSEPMFREFFLEEIVEEVEWLDRSIYHLDGPGALRHLDTLLEIERLDAIQYVIGAGNEPASRWMHVFRRIQEGGKNLHIDIAPDELDTFMEALRPEGVMLKTWARTPEEADALVARVARWGTHGRAR